jgi:hypothetical protein
MPDGVPKKMAKVPGSTSYTASTYEQFFVCAFFVAKSEYQCSGPVIFLFRF